MELRRLVTISTMHIERDLEDGVVRLDAIKELNDIHIYVANYINEINALCDEIDELKAKVKHQIMERVQHAPTIL